MKLYLINHDYKYAAEQILMAVLPARPEYSPDAPDETEDYARVALEERDGVTKAVTALRWKGRTVTGEAASDTPMDASDELAVSREHQRLIKLSFYRAAAQVLPEKPVWGALTGIRPGVLATKRLAAGASDGEALRYLTEECYVREDRAKLCLDTAHEALRVKETLLPRDVALYIGIPFCPTRCAYCSFVSQSVEKSMGLMEPYLAALEKEIRATARLAEALRLRPVSVYIGGGTPTTLSASELRRLLDTLAGEFDLSAVREFTVEAGRPDTVTEEKLLALRGTVTRVSVNPQSMSDAVLRAIGRSHTAEDVRRAYTLVRQTLPCDVNMDVIAGLPADTVEGFDATLRELIGLAPENLTVHTLALKRGTKITEEDTARPGKPEVERMLTFAGERLRAAGYGPYYLYRQKFMSGGFENVGWSVPGRESLYNVLIMEELCTILAMGGGGSTKLVDASRGRVERLFAPKYPKEYTEEIERVIAAKQRIAAFYEELS